MRRMIENLDEFKRTDGNPEYQVIKDTSDEKDIYIKRYSKSGITPNSITFVVDLLVKPGKKLDAYTAFTTFKVPLFVENHLGVDKTIGTCYVPVTEESTREVKANVVIFLVHYSGTGYQFMLANGIDNTAGTDNLEFRAELTFIL